MTAPSSVVTSPNEPPPAERIVQAARPITGWAARGDPRGDLHGRRGRLRQPAAVGVQHGVARSRECHDRDDGALVRWKRGRPAGRPGWSRRPDRRRAIDWIARRGTPRFPWTRSRSILGDHGAVDRPDGRTILLDRRRRPGPLVGTRLAGRRPAGARRTSGAVGADPVGSWRQGGRRNPSASARHRLRHPRHRSCRRRTHGGVHRSRGERAAGLDRRFGPSPGGSADPWRDPFPPPRYRDGTGRSDRRRRLWTGDQSRWLIARDRLGRWVRRGRFGGRLVGR